MRDFLASGSEALVLRGERIGLSRYSEMREAELRSWARRLETGAVRFTAGGALEVDARAWPPASYAWIEGPTPSTPFFSFHPSIQGLRRLFVWHGDVAPPGAPADVRTMARHAYVGAALAALAPVAGTLEELSIRIQTKLRDDRRRLPQGAAREAIAAGLRRLTALRSLDLADCIGVSGELLMEVGPAVLGGLRSLRVAQHVEHGRSGDGEARAAAQRSLAFAIARRCPLLEELRVAFHCPSGAAPSTRRPSRPLPASPPRLDARVYGLSQLASAHLETLELDTHYADEQPAPLLYDVASIKSLQNLTLLGKFSDWAALAMAPNLRSLSLGTPERSCELPAGCLAVLPALPALERLSVHLIGYSSGAIAASLRALAAVLASAPFLRSLVVSVCDGLRANALDPAYAPDRALAPAAAAFLHAARDTLEEYDREAVYPTTDESSALAACTRLRRASLTLAVPASAVAASAEGLAALAPLASMAARPAPAPGDLVLARGPRDASDWGATRALLGGRWRLEEA
eukprot:tig00020553_g10753.t1